MTLDLKSPAQRVNLEISRGRTWRYQFFLTDPASATEEELIPINITGWEFFMDFRRTKTSAVSLLSLSTRNRLLTVDDPSLGAITVEILPDQSRHIIGSGVWDLLGIDPNGDRFPLMEGQFKMLATVSEPHA